MSDMQEVISHLELLRDDEDASAKLKEKAAQVISILNSDEQLVLDKALMQLEDLNTTNLQSYHRTQVWDIISMIESVK